MTNRFRNKYLIESSRLQNWDYSWNAAYYVTVCTKNRECYFGEIIKGQMNLSEIGLIVDNYWNSIPKHFPFVLLDTYVIMPNHLHGIMVFNKTNKESDNVSNVETPKLGVSTLKTSSRGRENDNWKHGNLGVVINQFKRICTIDSRKIDSGFAWQSRFYDHVIRNDESLVKIRFYIKDNPEKWAEDQLNPNNERIYPNFNNK